MDIPLTNPFQTANFLVTFKDDIALFDGLAKIVNEWASFKKSIPSLNSIDDLLDRVFTDLAGLQTAFHNAGLDQVYTSLTGVIDRIESLGGILPEKYHPLLRPLSSLGANGQSDGQILLQVSEALPVAGGAKQAPIVLTPAVGATASLTFDSTSNWPFSGDSMPSPLVLITAAGKANAAAGITVPFQFGSAGVDASASADVTLGYYYNPPRTVIYAAALAEALSNIANPFDFDSIWSTLTSSDCAGITLDIEGKAGLSGQVTVGLDQELLDSLVKADLGLSVKFGLNFGGAFTLSLRNPKPAQVAPNSVAMVVSRNSTSGSNLGLGIGLTLDLSDLTARIHALLTPIYQDWGKITPFLTPGTWLQNQMNAQFQNAASRLLSNTALRSAVEQDLDTALGIDTSEESALLTWMQTTLVGAIDHAGTAFEASLSDATDGVLTSLAKALPAFADPLFSGQLSAAISQLLEPIREALVDDIKALLANGVDFGKLLSSSGNAVKTIVKDLDSAFSAFKAAFDKYSAFFKKIYDATENAAYKTISVNFNLDLQSSKADTTVITAIFSAKTGDARNFFNDALKGRFRAVNDVLANPGAFPSVEIDAKGSSLARSISRTTKSDFAIVAIGTGIDLSTALTSCAAVMVDANGKIQIDTQAQLDKRFKGLDETRELTFADTVALTMVGKAGASPDVATRTLTIGFSITDADATMTRDHVRGFAQSLEAVSLLPAGTTNRIVAQYNSWGGGPGSQVRLNADLTVNLRLDTTGIEQLLQIGARRSNALTPADRVAIIDTAIRALVRTGAIRSKDFEASATSAWEEVHDDNVPRPASTASIALALVNVDPEDPSRDLGGTDDADLFFNWVRPLNAFADALDQMGKAYLAPPSNPLVIAQAPCFQGYHSALI